MFGFIPKLPLFLLLFVVIDFGSKVAEKKSLKAGTGDILARTKTFQTTLLIFMMFLGLGLNFAAEDQPAVPVIDATEGEAAEGVEPLEEAHDDVAEADETEKTEE